MVPINQNDTQTHQIIESDQPLIGLMDQFGNGLNALRFYAAEMTDRFGRATVGTQCCCCERRSVSRVDVFCWRALVNPRFAFTRMDALMLLAGRVGMTLQHTVVDFATFHGFCEDCASKTKRARWFSVVVKSISFFLLLVCMMVIAIAGGGVIMFWSDPKDRHEFLIGFLAGAFGLVASIYGHVWERNLRIPKFARTIGRKPFFLAKVADDNPGNPK